MFTVLTSLITKLDVDNNVAATILAFFIEFINTSFESITKVLPISSNFSVFTLYNFLKLSFSIFRSISSEIPELFNIHIISYFPFFSQFYIGNNYIMNHFLINKNPIFNIHFNGSFNDNLKIL